MSKSETFHGTTIIGVRRDNEVVVGGDGQVTLGNTVMKNNAKKLEGFIKNKSLLVLPELQQMPSPFLRNLKVS